MNSQDIRKLNKKIRNVLEHYDDWEKEQDEIHDKYVKELKAKIIEKLQEPWLNEQKLLKIKDILEISI